MIKFDIITIFPDIFTSYFNESIIQRAQNKKLVKINIHNLRDYTKDKHKSVDDKPYGGGPGMVMIVEPIYKAVTALLKSEIRNPKSETNPKYKFSKSKTRIILFSPKGKKFDQKMAKKFSKLDQLIMICGRYEGVDERAAKYVADEEISIGDYVITGGELPAMIVVDAVTRLIPGVIALESLQEESFGLHESRIANGKLQTISDKQLADCQYEYPQYTRPESVTIKDKERTVPKILLSGNHKKINQWRKKHES